MSEKKLPTLGFLGSGAIVNAMVSGFCLRAKDTPYPIVVSSKSGVSSRKLQEQFPDRVTAAESLQACVDSADWVVIAILPKAGEEVLRALKFRPEQKVINLMFDKTVEQCAAWMNCKVDTMLHMIPGTFLTAYPGPIVQCPPTPEAAEIFGHIGRVVSVESRYHAAVFAAITACFTPIFNNMDRLTDWAVSEGVPPDAAAQYVTNMFTAVCQEACDKDREGLRALAASGTPGGINLQARDLIDQAGGFQAWVDAMDPVLARAANGIPKP